MPTVNLGELVTTTLRNRSKKLADNVSLNNALLFRLKERGKQRPFDGGRTIVEELEYAENSTFMWYSGYETLNISPSTVFDAAEFQIKQASVAVSISGLEELQNAGKERVIPLLEKRIQNAEKTFMNQMAAGVYSDGTAAGGKQIGGLNLLVSSDPTTGTVGGIDRATWTFWRHYLYDFSVKSITASATTIQAA
ncbi:MAG: phage major capsid protein, partial [Dongiaceae bacterium]